MSGYGKLPAADTQEYLWWSAGAADEAKALNEGLTSEAREAREVLVGLARLKPGTTAADLVHMLAKIYCPGKLRRRYR